MKRRRALAGGVACALSACAGLPAAPPDFSALVRRSAPAVLGVGDTREVLGSGFLIAHTRWVATAAHVLRSLQGPPVIRWGAARWTARVRIVDDDTDLALLELDAEPPTPGLALATGEVAVGQWVLVLGCPFGTLPTATTGIVSALPGAVTEPEALATRLQLNAAVNPGNSGGPVLDLAGEVIGVANATIPGGYGLGFAVPVATLQALVNRQCSRS